MPLFSSAGFNAKRGAPRNSATGGVITDITKNGVPWKRHTFTSNGTFTVVRGVFPFTVAVFGGGGGGGGAQDDFWSDWGGQGGIYAADTLLSLGAHAVTIGQGGAGGLGQFGGGITDGGYGGDTSVAGAWTAGGGGKGGGAFPPPDYAGRPGNPSPAADGYANNVGNSLAATYGLASTVGNGGANNRYGNNGFPGVAGAVVIEYAV